MKRRISLATLTFLIILNLLVSNIPIGLTEVQEIERDESSIKDFGTVKGITSKLDRGSGELTISKWENEVSFIISTPDIPTLHKVEDSKEILEYQSYTARVYEIAEGMEYEIIFASRPLSNIIPFKIESEGLNFYYQPPLSDEVFPKNWVVNETHAIDEKGILRNYRPINIVGSYAVYGENWGNKYTTGKMGHIYRPLVYDSRGESVWGELVINAETGIMTITIPDTWLDNANYPIYVDPTFGKTDKGGTGWNVLAGNTPSTKVVFSEDATITHINFYIEGANANSATAIYDHDVVNDEPENIQLGSNTQWCNQIQWNEFDVTDTFFSAGTYWLAAGNITDNNLSVWWDSAGRYTLQVGDFPDPYGASISSGIRQISIYANYTVAENYYLDVENLTLSTLLAGENITVSMDLETNSTPAFYWFGENSSGEWKNNTAQAWTVNGSVSGWFWGSPQIGYPFGVIGYANTTDNLNSTSGFFLTVSDTVTLITEEIWIALIVFMFLVVIGYLKKDAILHLISVVVGIALMITFFSSDPYMGFIMAIISIYMAWYALWVEWDQKE